VWLAPLLDAAGAAPAGGDAGAELPPAAGLLLQAVRFKKLGDAAAAALAGAADDAWTGGRTDAVLGAARLLKALRGDAAAPVGGAAGEALRALRARVAEAAAPAAAMGRSGRGAALLAALDAAGAPAA